jgi:hypothetical protein
VSSPSVVSIADGRFARSPVMTEDGDKPPVTANNFTAKWETLKSWFATHKSQSEIQNSNPEIIANVISAGNGLVGSGLERVWVAP